MNGDNNLAHQSLSWLTGDQNIPADIRKSIGVKGSVDKNNVLVFKDLTIYY